MQIWSDTTNKHATEISTRTSGEYETSDDNSGTNSLILVCSEMKKTAMHSSTQSIIHQLSPKKCVGP